MPRVKKSVPAAERASDYHAGPHDSEPLDPNNPAKRLKAAWDLRGRVKGGDPDEIARKIINFAREHGVEDQLPQDAHDYIRKHTGDLARKAKGDDLREMMRYAYQQIPDYEPSEKRRFIEIVQNKGNAHMLPDEAHGFMHENNMPHQHEGEDHPQHVHVVSKAFNPVSKEFVSVKSWSGEDGQVHIEGWLSTEDQDLEKDIVRPESFQPAMKGYFRRNAPLSYEHKTDRPPIGHIQKAALVRDGLIFHSDAHPTDPAEFQEFPNAGTGVYVRGVINDPVIGEKVRKGDMGAFSYIANVTRYKLLPGGGREFLEQNPWLESTVAAYPINSNAVITVAKAYGLEEPPQMDWESKLEELLAGAATVEEPKNPAPAVKSVTADEIKGLLTEFKTAISAEISAAVESQVEERVQKALTTMRGVSQGRQTPPSDEPNIDDNPLEYIVRKAEIAKSENDLTLQDKQLMWGITRAGLLVGMKDSDN